jgi:flavin reductase (DIM6/NTAB) family NADH-FMN oxidoreductase RutF
MDQPIDPAQFRAVLGHCPTGVAAITSRGMMGSRALVVGTFTSVSLDPPLVGFLPTKGSASWAAIAPPAISR